MTTTLTQILIFKTNIRSESDKSRVKNSLNDHAEIQQWNIDLHDIDCVLRIVTESLTPEQIISIIKLNGFDCAELE